MRKHQQRQILELLRTINEAQTDGFFAECQEGAIGVGEYIESIEGEGTHTVMLLEEYCELLFKASNGEVGEKQLRKHLIQVENSVKTELKPNRIEIAFLSYKASMSDSIESIYLAAKDDPHCDAYWIPIPYYDRESDGSFSTMHYEGAECYGSNIEVTDWQQYNIEARHPDIVFTFNPYDAGNYVTSIHPDYYCERLRELTDLLVYVPYFVATNDVAEHFVTTAGCIYAHKVIVQSEKIRETYIRVFREHFGSKLGKPEEKFISLGSPKFDKVINSKREDYTLPSGWSILIGGKKVVLYNTSVGSLLAGNEQYLKKLRHVLSTFRKRDDTVLWWRPHPLSEATCQSMRPQLLEEYKRIISDYKSEGWGVFDDTIDLHRAISWSDAYYGDWSSLVSLYQATGKPVLIQDALHVFGYERFLTPVFVQDETGDATQWVMSMTFNGLYKVDLNAFKADYIGSFPGERPDTFGLYISGVMKNKKIFFAPFLAKEMAAYDTESSTFSKIPLPASEGKDGFTTVNSNFRATIAFGRYVFFLPHGYPAILRYDTESGAFDYYADCIGQLLKLGNGAQHFFQGYTVIGSEIIAVAGEINFVVVFNMSECISTISEVGSKGRKYSGICYDGIDYWLSPSEGGVFVRWNRQTGQWKEYPTDFGAGVLSFGGLIYLGKHIWAFPLTGKAALRINPEDESIEVVSPLQTVLTNAKTSYHFCNFNASAKRDGKLLVFACRSAELVEYNPEYEELKKHPIIVDQLEHKGFMSSYGDFNENDMYKLTDYLDDIVLLNEDCEDSVKRSMTRREVTASSDGKSGENILTMLKGLL